MWEQWREMMGRGCGGVRVEVCVRGVGDMGRRDETRRGQQVYDSDRSSEKGKKRKSKKKRGKHEARNNEQARRDERNMRGSYPY